ncbi:MAG: pyrophosphatase [Flavobacteriaceae bacterium]|nr:pyrophosphatase [Flavobacteriaceae bacterium]|tara:strand:+ start:184 stop:513 length:330 start_codon:yes stop_codon:yes gene_type:complete
MEINTIQKKVDEWIKNHGVRYFDPMTNLAQLTEEVGEVARIISRKYGEQSPKTSDKKKDLAEELSDVLFVVICIANQTGCDLQKAFKNKLNLKADRDHDRHHNNPKLKN